MISNNKRDFKKKKKRGSTRNVVMKEGIGGKVDHIPNHTISAWV